MIWDQWAVASVGRSLMGVFPVIRWMVRHWLGPPGRGLFGSTVNLSDGTSVLADEDYLLESIIDPNAKIHEGFNAGVMPQTFGNTIPESDLNDIIEFIKNLQ